MLDLERMKRWGANLTPGPWVTRPSEIDPDWIQVYTVGMADYGASVAQCPREEDAAFIAMAQRDIPALVAEVERLTKALNSIAHYPDAWHHAQGVLANELK